MPDPPPFPDGAALSIGRFQFLFDAELWEWSAEAALIHGYPALKMSPTSEQVMSHKHPEDYAKIALTLEHVRRSQGSINTRHRIIDVAGDIREVAIVGQRLCDDAGHVIGTHGFYLDVTPAPDTQTASRRREQSIGARVDEIAQRRTVIDEVKGMLMLIYRIDDEHAFDLLRWRSQLTNTKLRPLALRLRIEFGQLDYDQTLPTRAVFDQLLLTAHERITPEDDAA